MAKKIKENEIWLFWYFENSNYFGLLEIFKTRSCFMQQNGLLRSSELFSGFTLKQLVNASTLFKSVVFY